MATKVFICWSGDLSRKLAEAIRDWLPQVIQAVKPYFAPSDTEKGVKWASDILGELESSDIGIICLTKYNLEKPWILFESGALSKSLAESRVCTILFDVKVTDITGPLAIFQHTSFSKDDFLKLVETINERGGDSTLSDPVLGRAFSNSWPELEAQVTKILAEHEPSDGSKPRSEREMLQEILELSRLTARRDQLAAIPRSGTFAQLALCVATLANAVVREDQFTFGMALNEMHSVMRRLPAELIPGEILSDMDLALAKLVPSGATRLIRPAYPAKYGKVEPHGYMWEQTRMMPDDDEENET